MVRSVRQLLSAASCAEAARCAARGDRNFGGGRWQRAPNGTHFVSVTALAAGVCIENRWETPAASAVPLTDQS